MRLFLTEYRGDKMKLIFCVDENNGMMFMDKRQSQDRVLRKRILEITSPNKLWMSKYSAGQFEFSWNKRVSDDYMRKADDGDYCFIEDKGFSVEGVSEIILCNWNRSYPATRYFDVDLEQSGFEKVSTEEIVGSSHDKITIDTYRR
jgi:hypothetical protein